MNTFETVHRVPFSVSDMFKLVADVESYPEFVPLCESLKIRQRERQDHKDVLTADMTAAYKFISESFTSRVEIDPEASKILVEYIDGPFRHMENRWRFREAGEGACDVDFFIAYEFRSYALQLLMGALFEKAFRKFVDAFETRAHQIYGKSAESAEADATAS